MYRQKHVSDSVTRTHQHTPTTISLIINLLSLVSFFLSVPEARVHTSEANKKTQKNVKMKSYVHCGALSLARGERSLTVVSERSNNRNQYIHRENYKQRVN